MILDRYGISTHPPIAGRKPDDRIPSVNSSVPSDARGAQVDEAVPDLVLADVVRRLVAIYMPERVYMFGSRARGEAGAASDYDVLVVVSGSDEPIERRARRGYAALEGVPAAVDVLVWTREEFDERL